MPIELKVPAVGESVSEVEIGDWLVKPGESVKKDDPVVMIETDKVTVELVAPCAGTVTEQRKNTGDMAAIGEVVGLLEAGEAASVNTSDASVPKAANEPAGAKTESAVRVMPAAQRALHDENVQLDSVTPTGPGERVLKEDVLRAAGKLEGPPVSPSSPSPEPKSTPVDPPILKSVRGAREEEAVPMTSMRRRIAKRLVESQQTAALLTTFNEVDMSAVMDLRAAYKESFAERHGTKLGFMSFFVKAAVEALKMVPAVNAEIRGNEIIYRNYFDIGIAVGGGKGLVVPVLRNAEAMSFATVEKTIRDFGQRAKSGKITLDELMGGTFTISNGGVYGSMLSTPIVNPPQSGILGLHAIKDRPAVVDGQVVVRPIMYLALTYDHRIIDGREAVTFLKHIKESIEEPARILLEL